MLESFSKEVIGYCESHTIREHEVLDRIEQSTHANARGSLMISGAYQGALLRMLSRLIRPNRILEIGTFTGYSAVCMAEGLGKDGKLISFEIDETLKPLIEEHISWSPHASKIEVRYGDAKVLLGDLDVLFDMVFIDAAKREYDFYYEESIRLLNPGGLMVIDNVLWRGKVALADPDPKTKSIQQFNDKIREDERVQPFLMPIRDGIYLVQKI